MQLFTKKWHDVCFLQQIISQICNTQLIICPMKRISFVLTFSLAALSLFAQDKQTLPELTLKDVNGKMVNVADYSRSGKITIISFWATWCTPCKKELSNINELLDDWKSKYGLQLVAVSTDNARNVTKVKPFVDGQAWTFDCLLDVLHPSPSEVVRVRIVLSGDAANEHANGRAVLIVELDDVIVDQAANLNAVTLDAGVCVLEGLECVCGGCHWSVPFECSPRRAVMR